MLRQFPLTSTHSSFWIKREYDQTPPPPEILENITAAGADLLNRTTENFKVRQDPTPTNGEDMADGVEEESRTPKEEKMDLDDPGSGGGRVTRGEYPFRFPFLMPHTHAHSRTPTGSASACTLPARRVLIQADSPYLSYCQLSISTNSSWPIVLHLDQLLLCHRQLRAETKGPSYLEG